MKQKTKCAAYRLYEDDYCKVIYFSADSIGRRIGMCNEPINILSYNMHNTL